MDDRSSTPPSSETDQEVVSALVHLGLAADMAAEYVRRDEVESGVFDAVLLPGRMERTVTPEWIAEQGGPSVAEIAELMEAFGLPKPRSDQPAFTPEEAIALVDLGGLEEVWSGVVRKQVGRVYGATLSAIARSEIQAFQLHTEPTVRQGRERTFQELRRVKAALERLVPLTAPLLLGVHLRWIEHELAQHAVRAVERHAGTEVMRGAAEVTFLFCDLKNYTAYAEHQGDAVAIATVERFFDVVDREVGEGELVKSLGDGAMLVYDDPADAAAAGARVIAAMRPGDTPGVHASVHRGIALTREGDFFGGSVNLTARLLAFAGEHELVATSEVVAACPEMEWSPAGERVVRGVDTPVSIYKLSASS